VLPNHRHTVNNPPIILYGFLWCTWWYNNHALCSRCVSSWATPRSTAYWIHHVMKVTANSHTPVHMHWKLGCSCWWNVYIHSVQGFKGTALANWIFSALMNIIFSTTQSYPTTLGDTSIQLLSCGITVSFWTLLSCHHTQIGVESLLANSGVANHKLMGGHSH